jgi:hypothetical protein
MPSWRIHLLFSVILFFFWLKFLSFINFEIETWKIGTLVFLFILASVFADIDSTKSKIRKLISLVIAFLFSILVVFLAEWFYVPIGFLLVYAGLRFLPTVHRGVLHTFKFCVVFSLIVGLALLIIGFTPIEFLLSLILILISYGSHLILDGIL